MKLYWAKKKGVSTQTEPTQTQVNGKRRGPKTNAEKEVLRKNVFSRPTFLDSLPSRGEKAKAIALLSEQLKNMNSTECVALKVPDFIDRFKADKYPLPRELTYVRTQLRVAYGVKNPKIACHDSMVYIWTGFNGNVKK